MDPLDRAGEINQIKPLLGQVQSLKVLTPDQERHYIGLAQSGDKKSQDYVVKCNLRLVVREAKKFMGRGISLEDLVQEGTLGLIRAIEKFDLDKLTPKGTYYKFSTYATPWIKQPMFRAMGKKSRIVRVPDKELSMATALHIIYKDLIESRDEDGLFGTKPTPEELAEVWNNKKDIVAKFGQIDPKKAKELGRINHTPVYLDSPVGEEENMSLVDYLIDEDYSPEEKSESSADKEYIASLLSNLTKADSDFIKLKYGFVDDQERTDRQMAILLKIPIKEVKSRETRILSQLRGESSMFDINAEILCNVVIVDVPGDKYHAVFNLVQRHTNLSHTMLRCMLKTFPVTAFSKVNQHQADNLRADLEEAGAQVSITKFE